MKVFVDTGAWFAFAVASDKNHKPAVHLMLELMNSKTQLHTTDYVIDELLTLVRMKAGHEKAVHLGRTILERSSVHVEKIIADIWSLAWSIFKSHKDKTWSFTDCTSFACMELRKISKAFAFDGNFRQYGVVVLR